MPRGQCLREVRRVRPGDQRRVRARARRQVPPRVLQVPSMLAGRHQPVRRGVGRRAVLPRMPRQNIRAQMRVRLRRGAGWQGNVRDGPQVHRGALQVHGLRRGVQARQIQPRERLQGWEGRASGVRRLLPEDVRAPMRRVRRRDGQRRIVRQERDIRRGDVRAMRREPGQRVRRLRVLRHERVSDEAEARGVSKRDRRRDEDREARVRRSRRHRAVRGVRA
mmetsp:Transcript_4408/g.19753  ORF Transcript_4408/g.19753 Transcript_4408/m.19753 type:complete len:221 (-) Transcript_4408:2199-2861(-)